MNEIWMAVIGVLVIAGCIWIAIDFAQAVRSGNAKNPFGVVRLLSSFLRIHGQTETLSRAGSPVGYWAIMCFLGLCLVCGIALIAATILVYFDIVK